MPKKESQYSQAMEEDAKNCYPLLINQMKMSGRSENYMKKFIDGMKETNARTQNKQSTYAKPKPFNP